MNDRLLFDRGTLILNGSHASDIPWFKIDNRTKDWRAPAYLYREIILHSLNQKLPIVDDARAYKAIDLKLEEAIEPREHQRLALAAWKARGSRGIVSLPTGAGKTILAVLAIVETKRPTLIVVPTIDLLHQWREILSRFFGGFIGQLGAGVREIRELTVATYDSAAILGEKIGNIFGLLVFDECHHLPASQYQLIARTSIAPFRLGLSATVERSDGRETELFELVGEICYESDIHQMVNTVLSPYDVVSIQIPLTDSEKVAYQASRGIYTDFVKRVGIDFSHPDGWREFILKATTLPGGKAAMEAYREQKRLAQGAEGKILELWRILKAHRGERIIVFTQDNATAYLLGKTFILPVLTHQTKSKERKSLLAAFRAGELDVLVTSKVLNEGVDVPEASVGVVISGSGAVREHVQRLGRILRHKEGKKAKLYELVSKDTSEYFINQRRRNHNAYQKPNKVQHSWR